MNTILKYPAILFAIIMLTASCSRNDDNSPSPSVTPVVTQGSWKITYFDDSGNDETSHFTGCSFQFNSNGSVVATKGSDVKNGTWSSGNDNSTSKLVLNFGGNPPFDDLNEDWHVTMQSSTVIKLQHISGGNGGTDNLYFEKL